MMEREEGEEGGGEGCMEGGMWVVTGLPDLMVRFTVNLTILVQFHANFTDSSFFRENRYEYRSTGCIQGQPPTSRNKNMRFRDNTMC